MATSDYNSSIDLRLPLYPDTKPSYDLSVFTDINALFTAIRLLAEGVQEQLANKVDEAPEDGQSYVRQDGEWVVDNGGSLALLSHPTYQTLFINNSVIATAAMTNNLLRVGRILFPSTVKVTPQVRVSTAVALSKLTAALYSVDATTGLPGIRFVDLGEVDCSTVGIKSLPQLTIPAGEYFLVWHGSLTAAVYYGDDVLAGNPLKRYDLASAAVVASYSATLAYTSPLPNPFSYTVTPAATVFRSPIFFRIDAP